MNDSGMMLLALLAIGTPIALLIWSNRRLVRKQRSELQTFADRHGFECDASDLRLPRISGEIDGRTFRIGGQHTGLDKYRSRPNPYRQSDFAMGLSLKGDLPDDLLIGRGNFRSRGEANVETGDRKFDKKVVVQCADPEAGRQYLSEERKQALLELQSIPGRTGYGTVIEETVGFMRLGYTPKADWLEDHLDRLLHIAEALDGTNGAVPDSGQLDR